MIRLKAYAAKTDQGPFLKINEDAYEVDLGSELFMIFDGYGGVGIGDKALDELKNNIKNFYLKVGGDSESTLPFFYSAKYLLEANALINAIEYSHKILYENNLKLRPFLRAGASSVMGCLSENILTLISIGNCTCFVDRRGHFKKILQEDTLRAFDVDQSDKGVLNCPLSGFGLFEDIHYKISELKVQDGDSVIFLTDGVYQYLSEQDIKSTIEIPDISLSEKIDNLFKLANTQGNQDNQSAIILKF